MPDEATINWRQHPPPRGLGRRKSDRQRVNWSVVAMIATITMWLVGGALGWFGTNAEETKKIAERLATLEAQRQEDIRRSNEDRADSQRRMERIEDKLDRVLERVR